ncbi:Hypothetical predicted protein [Marmota monax]|uniref:A-kinase anchoring protein 13 n=1 Tax=Marmota monax TaxID=9995 RepID=A0A5E4C2N7_MARMO|nr:Hypothetical predicted protein [Marmota monax]
MGWREGGWAFQPAAAASYPTLITLLRSSGGGQPQPPLATRAHCPERLLLASRSLMGSSTMQSQLLALVSALTHRRAPRFYGPPLVPRPKPGGLRRMPRSRSGRGEAPGLGRNRRVGSSPSSRRRRAAVCCLSPRRRCRAAPARPAGEPREPHVSWVMKLNPQQAPLYGDCVVTVLLAEEDKVEDDVVFYVVFSGSTLHHCTSTRKVSSDTLETIAPGHDCCETVKVLLCASKEGLPVFVVAEEDFHFVQDEAYDAAQFLATSAGNQQALNFTRFLDRSGPPSGDVNSLDEKVALAFRHLKLPAEWNVLGTDQTLHGENCMIHKLSSEHFCFCMGLLLYGYYIEVLLP